MFALLNIIIFCIPRQRTVLDPTTATAEDIKVERYMRDNALDSHEKKNNNREEMMKKFKLTRESRRAYIKAKDGSSTKILNKYPRLKDMPETVILGNILLLLRSICNSFFYQYLLLID